MSSAKQETFSIAVVDDDDIYRDFVMAVFSASGRFVTAAASNGSELCDIIANQPIDCIILDYHLGDESGFSIKQLLQDRFDAVPPIVMLTGDDSQSTVISALRLGVSDYVPKRDMNVEVLFSAIDRAIAKDRKEKHAVSERRHLLALATRDGLTGLANRRAFDEALTREYKRARRNKTCLGLILIDIDFFKPYNDRYGHPAGDACLIKVSDAIRTAIYRAGDTPARYGGEEFAVIIPETDEAGSATIAERIRRAIFDLALPHHAGGNGVVTISAGVASVELSTLDRGAGALLELADRALYGAKGRGRNTVVCASSLPIATAPRTAAGPDDRTLR